jgi:hypothetical protein
MISLFLGFLKVTIVKMLKTLVPTWHSELKWILFPNSFRSHQIQAVPTSSAGDGFKANLVFKEIEKKLEEVRAVSNITRDPQG